MTDSLEDLSARARRGMLDDSERRRLKVLRPPGVLMRARKPIFFLRRRLLG